MIEDQRRLLSNLITRLPLENLEDRVTQIVTGMCRQGRYDNGIICIYIKFNFLSLTNRWCWFKFSC